MKKSASKNKKLINSNHKISSYFTKIVNGSANKKAADSKAATTSQSPPQKKLSLNDSASQNGDAEVISLDDSDEDFVEGTPTSKRAKSILSTSINKTTLRTAEQPSPESSINVLEAITNLPKCSKTPDYVQTTPESKKRKHSRENTPSPDFIPCSLNAKEQAKIKRFNSLPFPPRKKTVKENNKIEEIDLSNLPKEECERLQSPSKNNHDVKSLPAMPLKFRPLHELLSVPSEPEVAKTEGAVNENSSESRFSSLCSSPPKRNSTTENRTPTKLKRSTSKLQMQKSGKTLCKKSPSPTKRVTPTRLFGKSPKSLQKFNVEVMDNFVTVTPSKSEYKRNESSPHKSPSVSARSVEIQLENENTPVKSPQNHHTVPNHSKVKTKLNFSPVKCLTQGEKRHSTETESNASINRTQDERNGDLLSSNGNDDNDINCMLNDSWDEDLNIVDNSQHTLDLTESQHCKIIDVQRSLNSINLILKSSKDNATALCAVEGFWTQTKLAVNDTVHITAVYDENKLTWRVDNARGLIVFEPDFLVSATSLVGALFCRRRSVLSEKYRGFEPCNRVMLVGCLVHKLLQEVLRNNVIKFSEVEVRVKKLLLQKDTIWTCYESSVNIDDVEKELMEFVPRIISFMKQYVRQHRQGNLYQKTNNEDWKGQIDSIQDIEENLWCPELGVKGKVDVSVRSGTATMPLELKTGRATVSLEHRGQVMLYIMMMNKFGYSVPSGLLLYLREGVLREVPVTEKEKRDLTILRNELTYYLTIKPAAMGDDSKMNGNRLNSSTSSQNSRNVTLLHSELPEPINHHNACTKCPYSTICCTYLKFENLNLTNNPLLKVQNEVLSHLEPAHLKYFIEWSSLLALEGSYNIGTKQLREIYTLPPEKREKNGQCIIRVRIKETVSECGSLFKHTFEKIPANDKPINLHSSGIVVGNYVVVSVDSRPAVAAGFVTHMDPRTIMISLDRDLTKRYSNRTFHLDTYNSSVSQTFNMTNLALLLEASEEAKKLREIIIDKRPPSFEKVLPKTVATKGTPILRELNKMQQKAVLKSLSANDYLLIKGMPGTGKTATIVSLVQLLVELKKTVLITSHTHSAVDNVCVRLQACGVNVLRLGAESKINAKLRSRSEDNLTKHCVTPEQLEAVYNSASVLAVTCLGSGHPVLGKRQLDVCIVDESTQVLQCSVFRALCAARKFILIGDPNQLPPVVKNREATARGLGESLFERLDSPAATVTLTMNYRMNESITAMANALTYKGELLTANNEVANATLNLPLKKEFLETYQNNTWIIETLHQSLQSSVKILDTGPVWNKRSQLPKHEIDTAISGDEAVQCSNTYETAIVVTLIDALLKAGVSNNAIGVIAPYRAQVSQISIALKEKDVEVSTVDQFQGRDKDVVLYSCTKSCATMKSRSETEFEILEDKRRLTVAVTRAKYKFILIGDLATMRHYTPFAKLLACLDDNCFVNLENEKSGFSWDDMAASCNLSLDKRESKM